MTPENLAPRSLDTALALYTQDGRLPPSWAKYVFTQVVLCWNDLRHDAILMETR